MAHPTMRAVKHHDPSMRFKLCEPILSPADGGELLINAAVVPRARKATLQGILVVSTDRPGE